MTQPPPAQPNNHLVLSILCLVFCCLPLGIYSVVKAAQVNGLWAQGQYAEAQKSADAAKKAAIWGAVIGIVGFGIYGILIATGVISFDTYEA